ncbi:MAG: hypothetical protein ISF22_06295 [Methanomassiliicoccus sp.]|nr:hypothetical protein [Methanomassiliicoccus sp.]
MSIRVVEPETIFSMEGNDRSLNGAERPIVRPAREMIIGPGDLPTRWAELPSRASEQPRLGQRDYAAAKYVLMDDRKEKGQISFETIVYKDHKMAVDVLVGMVSKMATLKLSRLDLGDAGVMIEAEGKVGRKMKAVAFIERNVYGLIMLSADSASNISDPWLISMARIMASRMR